MGNEHPSRLWLCIGRMWLFALLLTGLSRTPSVSHTAAAQAVEPDGRGLLRRVVESRRAIQRGRIILRSTISMGERQSKWTWTISFDGEKLRGDVQKGSGNGGTGSLVTDVSCYGCYPHNAHVYYTNEPPPQPGLVPGLVFSDSQEKSPGLHYVPEPRWFGCLPTDHMNSVYFHPIDFYDARPGGEVKVSRDTISGQLCWKVTWGQRGTTETPLTNTAWIVTDQGNAVRRIEQRWTGGVEFIDTTNASLQQHKASGIWFPTSWQYERREKGKVTDKEEAHVEIVSLNEPVFSIPIQVTKPAGNEVAER